MKFSPQQDAALLAVSEWYWKSRKEQPLYRLFGYAGTGKTTLAKHFAETVGANVAFAAYTGKAASVLQSKGCVNASTIHQLIYLPREKSKHYLRELYAEMLEAALKFGTNNVQDPEFLKQPEAIKIDARIKEELEVLKQPAFAKDEDGIISDYDMIIIDECSMVDQVMAEDLLSFGVPIIVLGDPAQLPPVKGGGAFTSAEPDFMLTEIHRQAKDNPILHLATLVRQGKNIAMGEYGESRVVQKDEADYEMLLAHDQIIVGKNDTRHKTNKWLRRKAGLDVAEPPIPGEKLVCLRNDHNIGMLNGTQWKVDTCELSGESAWDPDARLILGLSEWGEAEPYSATDIVAFGDSFYGQGDNRSWSERKQAQEYDYGYAMTCHKSQGSQWDSVLVRDESRVFRNSAKEWLYTALTRAAERVTVVKG